MTPGYKRYRHAWLLTLCNHECFLLRGIPATALHSGYDFDSLHLGHSFALGLCLGLCFYQGVRFKWGLLQSLSRLSSPSRISVILIAIFKGCRSVAPPFRVQIQPFQNRQRVFVNAAAFVALADPPGAIDQFQVIFKTEQDASLEAVSNEALKTQ